MNIPKVTIQELLEAGVHLGHKTLRWNPKMKKYIFGKRDSIHIIDLTQTLELINVALEKVYNTILNNGKILFVGLAPAAHGGTRTGRVFTGDRSSEFLYKCLYKANISNQSNSEHKDDGLKLKKAYITTALKCVPPGDKPKKSELDNCFSFFNSEIASLKNIKVIVALGKIAFDACTYFYKSKYKLYEKINFAHDKVYKLPDNIFLVGCYHPSPRNVNTGRVSDEMMIKLFVKA